MTYLTVSSNLVRKSIHSFSWIGLFLMIFTFRSIRSFQTNRLVSNNKAFRSNIVYPSTYSNKRSVDSILPVLSFPFVKSEAYHVFNFFKRRNYSSPLQQSKLNIDSVAATMSTETVDVTSDPYIWLEDVESDESLNFAKDANHKCLSVLGNPETKTTTDTYKRVLAVLESDDRIPSVSQYGHDDDNNPVVVNFWKDKTNPKGIWRKTTFQSYKTDKPVWQTILDLDELAKQDGISWVWSGCTALPRSRDVHGNGKLVSRCLLNLSRGGSDAVHVKEFDFTTMQFVTDEPFNVAEGKTRASYKSNNVLLVGTNFGPDSLTDSGYPRTIREWVRGTDINSAPVVHEGEKTDVSVGMYIADERTWGGNIYEVKYRSLTFYTSKYWIRQVQMEHLLPRDDPKLMAIGEPADFVPLDIQDDASVGFLGKMLFVTLRSDWTPSTDSGETYKRGSVIYTDVDNFIANGASKSQYTILFEPTDRTAYEYHTATKNYLILSTMDNVKQKVEFFKITNDGSSLEPVGRTVSTETLGQIRDCSCSPVDPYSGSDEFWFTTSDYVTPSTLFIADATKVETEQSIDAGSDPFIVDKLKSLPSLYDSSNLLVEQKFATSKDGTEIPYFIIMSKGTVYDGTNPTLLYGYGGFEVSLGPKYIATAGLSWLERGGVYVEGNIRGGGEFGPAWHQAALKANRNKAYEDFIAIAEHLITMNICQPKTLAIRGGSNGGLLMGNMYTMRPDLFGAIHCAVPLLDMKRYHTLLAGASWMAEYGNPDTDDWKFLEQYSPYHNLKPDADYPPILVTTSTRDDRVHPGHARKFVKKLWDLSEDRWKVYYYENIEGGHGGAADAKQNAFMTALAYDFMFDTLTSNVQK